MKTDLRRDEKMRGVLTEIAKETGISRQGVHDAIFKVGNIKYLKIYKEKKEQRENNFKIKKGAGMNNENETIENETIENETIENETIENEIIENEIIENETIENETIENEMNLRKYPLRGILTEIAKEQNVTTSAVYHSIFKTKNPKFLKIFKEKKEQREKEYNKYVL